MNHADQEALNFTRGSAAVFEFEGAAAMQYELNPPWSASAFLESPDCLALPEPKFVAWIGSVWLSTESFVPSVV